MSSDRSSIRFLAVLATLAFGTLAAGERSPARVETPPEPKGDPVRGEPLTAIFACQECHTLRQPDGMHLDRARLFAGGIPFAGPWGLVRSANVSVPARSFPDRVLGDTIRGRLAFKVQMPTEVHRHDAHAFAYVLEGQVVMQLKGQPAVTLKAEQTFYEGSTDVHVVGGKASNTEPARFVVVRLKAKGATILTPVKE